jgi:AcrR family transcriptional regulator
MRAMAGKKSETTKLSREVIVDAYLQLVENEGNDPVTLRRLGAALGVDPTAVYRHFRDKDEILGEASDRLLFEASEGVEPTGDWRDDLRALLMAMRRAYLTHPHTLQALQMVPGHMPHGSRLAERCLDYLRQGGLDIEQSALAFEALEDYTIGAALFDAAATQESLAKWRQVYASLPPEDFPNLTSVASRLYVEEDAAFEYGLGLMLAAIGTTPKAVRKRSA